MEQAELVRQFSIILAYKQIIRYIATQNIAIKNCL